MQADGVALVEEEVRELVNDSFLAAAPLVRASSRLMETEPTACGMPTTGAVLTEYRGLSMAEITELRRSLGRDVTYTVVKNTLAKRALEGTEYECVNDTLSGPSLFGFSMEDPGAAARLFKDFAKENEEFEVKVLAVSGQMLGAEQLDVLAKLPTRDQALSLLMSVMKAPATKLVQTMNEVPGKLVRTLAAVRDQKEAAA